MADLDINLAETITLVENAKCIVSPLVVRESEAINHDEAFYLIAPLAIELSLYETFSVQDQRPSLSSPTLVISMAESIGVVEGPLNKGASGNAVSIGPAPAPIAIPADYWVVGV